MVYGGSEGRRMTKGLITKFCLKFHVQGIIASGVNYVLQSWCVQRAGPFIASVYNPLQMVFAAALAVLILGDTVFLGTLVTFTKPPIATQ
jgi:drug/metabolite transporter (DMT)-like permease